MTARLDQVELLARDEIVRAPILSRQSEGCTDRSFGLPPALLLGAFALLFVYLGVMAVGFATNELVVPLAVCFFLLAAAVFVPAKWATMKPEAKSKALDWAHFRALGIDTATGQTSAKEAMTLVLLLPACILFWGIATVTIAALV